MRRLRVLVGSLVGVFWLANAPLVATEAPIVMENAPAVPARADILALIEPAQAWMLAQQEPNGAYAGGSVGMTALMTEALLGGLGGMPADDPRMQRSLGWLVAQQQADGGIYSPEEGVANYATALSLMAFAEAGDAATVAGATDAVIRRAQNFLISIQNVDKNDINYGGIGYGSAGKGQEDLSNTGFAIEALRRSGLAADHEALQRALQFVQRCQNYPASSLPNVGDNGAAAWVAGTSPQQVGNDLPWATDDGGAVYAPHQSKAQGSFDQGNVPSEVPELRSYGSMTYALIKSYLYLDLKPDDPRLQAALRWIGENYQFSANPGLPADRAREGLYYYYVVMAKSASVLGDEAIIVDGKPINWRADLLAAIQSEAKAAEPIAGQPATIWINSAKRWREGYPHVANSYMVKALKMLAE